MKLGCCASSRNPVLNFILALVLLPSLTVGETLPDATISKYTELSGKTCRLLHTEKETGSTLSECSGVDGYKLQVADDDERMSLNVVTPDGQSHPLHFWDVVTPAMSRLGAKAEWLVTVTKNHSKPLALIARINAREEGARRTTVSYLAVARITDNKVCVTDRILPGKSANLDARKAASTAADKPCLEPLKN